MLQCILAHDSNYGVGFDDHLPDWTHTPDSKLDMKLFVDKTKNKTLIVGRKTYESLPSKLLKTRNRDFLIFSKKNFYETHRTVTNLFDLNNELKYTPKEKIVIGGRLIYNILIDYVTTAYVTVFNKEYTCNAFLTPKVMSFLENENIHTSITNGEATFKEYRRLFKCPYCSGNLTITTAGTMFTAFCPHCIFSLDHENYFNLIDTLKRKCKILAN